MKLFKLIMTCVIATLLVISVTLNILLLCGYQFKKEDKNPAQPEINFSQNYRPENYEQNQTKEDNVETNPGTETPDQTTDKEPKAFYEDGTIKVTFVNSEDGPHGPVHQFKIENLGDKAVTVLFTDLYIDGHQVFHSGLTSEDIQPGTSTIGELYLLTEEWSQFTSTPDELSFVIKLIDPDFSLDYYSTDRLTLKV